MAEGAKSGPTFNGASLSAGGPAPPPAAAHRQRRSSCCGLCCILKYVLGILITLILIVGIAALVIWLVLRPSEPKFYVDTVQFNSITNSTSSNIVLGMSVRNPNKKIGIYYDTLQASARNLISCKNKLLFLLGDQHFEALICRFLTQVWVIRADSSEKIPSHVIQGVWAYECRQSSFREIIDKNI